MKPVLKGTLVTLTALFLGAVALEFFTGTLPGEIQDQRHRGSRMVSKINAFHQAHHRYPDDLSEAGVNRTWSRFGHWQYHPKTNNYRKLGSGLNNQ